MRRTPTFLRARRRARARVLSRRAGIGLAALLTVAGVAQLFSGGGDGSFGRIDRVAFTGAVRGEGVPTKPDEDSVNSAVRRIRGLLNGWYQRAFADPRRYGDGSFDDVALLFSGEAALGFVEDREALTIGSYAPRIERIRVVTQTADVAVFAEEGSSRYATVRVLFEARARLKDAEAPVAITQSVNLVLEERTGSGWTITNYYRAERSMTSIVEDA